MSWPIDRIEVDDLMSDYSAEELGIDPKNAAKIDEIKGLRLLSASQPWGAGRHRRSHAVHRE